MAFPKIPASDTNVSYQPWPYAPITPLDILMHSIQISIKLLRDIYGNNDFNNQTN